MCTHPLVSVLLLTLPLIACDSTPDAAPDTTHTADAELVDTRSDDVPPVPDASGDETLAADTSAPADITALDSSEPNDLVSPDDVDTTPTNDVVTDIDDAATEIAEEVIAAACLTDADCHPGELCIDDACTCDPSPVSFTNDLVPLFKNTCGTSCHVVSLPTGGSAGLNLSAAHAHGELVLADATQCRGADADRLRVVPGDIGASYLMDKLLGRRMCSGVRMPKGRAAYTSAQLAAVGRWICQGATAN